MMCNDRANGEVRGYLSHSTPVTWKLQLLPLEKAAVFVGTEKMTMDVGPKICFQLGIEEAMRFYTSPVTLVGGINKGGLCWLQNRFEQVSWATLEEVLHLKQLSKQYIGISATRRNMA
jgi:hypothetical protein